MRPVRPVAALALVFAIFTASTPPAAPAASYHRCHGSLPYAGNDGYPGFWRQIEARATPCRSAKPLAREATSGFARRPGRGNTGRRITVVAALPNGARYRCAFMWKPVSQFEYVNHAACKAHGGKRIRFRSIPAGD
jgi:hypothetical protein